MYVKVVGHLKAFQGKKSVNVNRIIPVDSVDELTHHFLQVIYTHNALTKPSVSSD